MTIDLQTWWLANLALFISVLLVVVPLWIIVWAVGSVKSIRPFLHFLFRHGRGGIFRCPECGWEKEWRDGALRERDEEGE